MVRIRGWISASLGVVVAYFMTAAPATAQCILCYTSAANSGDRGIRTLQIGILILLVPTMSILSGLVWIAVRRRNADTAAEASGMESKWEEGLTALRAGETSETSAISPRS
jgi:hypothetical protein